MIKNKYLQEGDNFDYYVGAMEAVSKIANFISEKELDKIRRHKLQIGTTSFNEAQYLQNAAELSVCSYFAEFFGDSFKYEDKVNPPKDVDCSFKSEGIQFNIEVKCADYSKSHKIDKLSGIHLDSLGRCDDFFSIKDDLGGIFPQEEHPVRERQNMDNKLKDFLISAHGKFLSSPQSNHLNVLVACCNTQEDIQKFHSYMYQSQGLFTENSFFDIQSYNLVDCVVLSNEYHRHYNYKSKNKITKHWGWGSAFNLIFHNPFSSLVKGNAILALADLVPNFSKDFFLFEAPKDSEGNSHPDLKIPYFIDSVEKKEKFLYFQP